MKERHSPALRRRLMAGLMPLALALTVPAGLAKADAFTPAPSETLLLAQHTDQADTHAEGDDHGSGGKQGGGGQGQRKRLGKGAGTGEARGGHSSESDIFRDEGFDKGPPAGKGGGHDTGDDHEDGEEGGGPPEGRGEHEDGETHDHEA
ncbi:hypothetical protein [Halomonas ventosae]|uniref:Uncharacterized protein n=1 Tax=Halomonas ventosae TaxID=229007 RepID=A0A2T0VLW3_9GAMM|nr:hypothetical protein [Halomonas ventosae]PRY71243.1 hypothetical protein BCL64_1082 [Halomonas ventosae]